MSENINAEVIQEKEDKKSVKDYIRKSARFFDTTSKILIWLLVIFSIIWVTWCFVLATIGKEQIAEALAQEVCRTVLGGVGVYCVTACISNIFKYNDSLFFGKSKQLENNNENES